MLRTAGTYVRTVVRTSGENCFEKEWGNMQHIFSGRNSRTSALAESRDSKWSASVAWQLMDLAAIQGLGVYKGTTHDYDPCSVEARLEAELSDAFAEPQPQLSDALAEPQPAQPRCHCRGDIREVAP